MRRLAVHAAVMLVVLLTGSALLHAQEAADLARRLETVRVAAADRDLAAVESRARDLLAAGPGADAADETRILLAKTRLAAGRLDEALAAVDPVVERPASIWHVKALYLVAEASARKRDWKRAADVYAARVDEASSEAHLERAAALYREIADGAFEGEERKDEFGRTERVRDWASARRYYEKARAVFVAEEDRPLVAYRIGLSALESGDPGTAVRELTALLDGTAGELADDALYALGRARLAVGDRPGARSAFTELRDRFGDSELAPLSLIRIGESWQTSGDADAARRAVEAWRTFLRLHPDHEEAPAVLLSVAATWAAAGRAEEASVAFLEFVEKHPDHEQAPSAQNRAAEARLALGDFDGAVEQWRVLLEGWPDHALWGVAQRKIAEASFLKGRHAFEQERDDDARAALQAFLGSFPVDDHAPAAQRLLGDLHVRGGEHEAAVEAWRLCATKYPQSAEAPAAMLQVAGAYEGPLADLDAALAAYEEVVSRWPRSSEAARARGILVEMKGKTLRASVARTFRTDDDPVVQVALRNVPALAMKAYRIDAADLARRRGALTGIESVDVDVVKPDHAWDWEPAEYERYRLLERDCPLPFDGPGAWIVTAADEELTARFLVLVSDLTSIVKSSPHGGLVFVYDERTGQPVSGARVHVLDGDRRGVTGADGVWREDDEGGGRLRAVVTGSGPHDGHFAFADASAGSATAFGYTTKVFLQTDRPLYRGGQTVHVRAIVRRVVDGRYAVTDGVEVPVRVTDPRGATLLDRRLATDAYGVLADTLELVPEPALGTYTVSAELDGRTFTRQFEVQAFRKPDVLVSVTPGRATYLAGDTVETTVSLRYAVGGVASAAPVRWAVYRGPYTFDASVHEDFAWFFRDARREEEERRRADAGTQLFARGEGVTDRDGTFAIEFTTQDVEEDRTYTLVVEAQDPSRRWVTASAAVPVTRQGFHVLCKTEKKVVRPGEAFDLDVTAVNALHLPVAAEGRAVLVRRIRVDQHWTEEDVLTVPAATDERGRASVELKAPRAGTYIARFVAEDQRGQRITGGAEITVSGEAEDLAKHAKLVADREFYREGDVAKVLVNVPSAPVPVLLTYEGDRVLEHVVHMATERSSTVELPLRASHAPNVFLRMAVAKEGALHEAGDEVAVFQYLDVSVQPDREVYAPGDEVTLTVRTTDQSGNPLRARVGIDVVDGALYELEPDTTPQIKPTFYDQRRTHAVRTASSAGVTLPALTQPTNPDLLFERMRRLGKARFEQMQEHVRLGRELLQLGQRQQAVEELEKALEIAPGNYEARGLLDELQAADDVLKESARSMDKKARPDAPATAGKPAQRPPAPQKQGGPENDSIGIGGGAGGAFGGRRGGRRELRARGGGGVRKNEDAEESESQDAALAFAADRDFRGRTENAMKRLSSWASKDMQGAVMLAQDAVPFVVPEARERFEDTAFTEPRVETGDDGTTRVTFTLPDNLTEWRVTARGASAGPLVGDTRSGFAVTKPLLIRADAPRFLVTGDDSSATGVVHSSLEAPVEAVVEITSTADGVTGSSRSQGELAPGSVTAYGALLAARDHGLAGVRASVATRARGDAAEVALPVIPRGLRRLDGASGTLTEEAFAELDLPASFVPGTGSLVVTVAPAVDVALIESLAYTSSYPYGCVEQTVNRFLPALAAYQALRDLDSPAFRRRDRLETAVTQGLASLYALQNPDGSFGWFGARSGAGGAIGVGDPEMTAYGLLGYVRAEGAGFDVSRRNRDAAIGAAQRLIRGAPADDRAFLLYALSFAEKAPLDDLNALYRERGSLSSRALALLALAMHATDRPTNALELTRRLESLSVREGSGAHWEPADLDEKRRVIGRPIPFVDAEPTAYAVLALVAVDPASALIDPAAEWLTASRRGPAWRSTRDTAAAIEALAAHAALRGVERATGTVEVRVNGSDPLTIDFGGAGARPVDAPVSLVVPADLLQPGSNRIALRRIAPGRVLWSALLSAIETPPASGSIEAGGTLLEVKRDYTEWVPPPLPGEDIAARIAPGYTIVVPDQRPDGWIGRPLARAGVGDKVRVTLRVSSRVAVRRVIVEDALPAGFEVVASSAEGPFDREERRDDRQAFFLSDLRGTVTLSYVLQAVHPGSYAALPAQSRAMYEPEIHGWSREHRMEIVPEPGAAGAGPSADEITPDEIWGLARRDAERGDWTAVRDALVGLLRDHTLRAEVAEEAWSLLFRAGIELDDAELIVRAFEEIVDRNPRRAPTGLRERHRLAEAYRTLGEHERALVVLRDLVREHFATDRAAAEAFAEIGNPWRTRELLLEHFRELPDAGWVEAEEWALAQRTAGMRVAGTGPNGPLMLTEAVGQLRLFEAHRPGSVLAHEAGHLAVQLLLRMGLAEEAIEQGTRFLGRHDGSKYLDDVTYLVAEGHFRADDFDRALAAARPLLEQEFPTDADPRRRAASPFRTRAIHLTARIAHARGELARAADLYGRVAHLFPDARDAHAFLTAQGLTLREVESVAVGATPELHMRRRNAPDVQLQVYAVDFMILYALRPDLSQVNRIDLTGVKPVEEWTVARRAAEDHRWSEETVPLPVRERGVYLVVARAGDLEASSVVLISDVTIEVQQTNGSVRIYATDRATGEPLPEVYVKVGDGQSVKAQGFTDARGVFEASGVGGSFSVVAEKDGNVALWRR